MITLDPKHKTLHAPVKVEGDDHVEQLICEWFQGTYRSSVMYENRLAVYYDDLQKLADKINEYVKALQRDIERLNKDYAELIYKNTLLSLQIGDSHVP